MNKHFAVLPYISILLLFIVFSSACENTGNSVQTNSVNSSNSPTTTPTINTNLFINTTSGATLAENWSGEDGNGSVSEQSVEVNLPLLNSLIEGNSLGQDGSGIKDSPNGNSVVIKIDGQEHSGSIIDVNKLEDGTSLILGNFQENGNEFTIIRDSKGVSGRFQLSEDNIYRLSQNGANNFTLTKYFQDQVKACRTRTPERPGRNRPNPPVPSPSGTPSYVNVLVLYTPDVRLRHNKNVEAGSREKIEQSIDELCNEAHGVFNRSNTSVMLSCLDRREVQYTASGSLSNDLGQLENPRDGSMDQIHAWRNETKADIVILFVNDSNEGGMANQMGVDELSPSFESKAFGVVDWHSALTGLLFPHEMGHIFGAGHDRENTIQPGPGRLSYSAGYHYERVLPSGIRTYNRTVMAYEIRSDQYLTSHFSNPDLLYPGTDVRLGTPQHNNAGTIRISAPTIAGFR